MVKALQRWLDTHQLPAIIAAVLGVVLTISVAMVLIGYLVTRLSPESTKRAHISTVLHLASDDASFRRSGRGKNG